MTILLASGCNESYYPKMRRYMESVHRHNTVAQTYLVGVGWQPPSELSFTGVELPLDKAGGHGGTSWCVQHGGFLHALPNAQPDDVMVFTDGGDVVMQRDFSPREVEVLQSLRFGDVWVGWDIDLNLKQDAERLRKPELRSRPLPNYIPHNPVFNTGVVACTIQTYWHLYNRYMARWEPVQVLFDHYARQQWLLSCILVDDPDFHVRVMPYSFHTHGHASLPYRCNILRDGKLRYGDEVVLFRHRVNLASLEG